MNNIEERIKSIIDERCQLVGECLMQYTSVYNWTHNKNKRPSEEFKQIYPEEYKKAVDEIFDELHPF